MQPGHPEQPAKTGLLLSAAQAPAWLRQRRHSVLCAAGMGTSGTPAWADLPADLWRRILLAAADASLCGDPIPDVAPEVVLAPWVLWTRLLASVSAVCRSMRSAVVGDSAGRLWTRLQFSSCYPGLSQQQSRCLNRLQAGRCRAIMPLTQVSIWGGGWAPAELREICALLPKQVQLVDLMGMHDAAEAEVIGAALAGASVQQLFFDGSAPFSYPMSLQALLVQDSFLPGSSSTFAKAQAFAQHAFTQLLRLSSLRVLVFHAKAWVMKAHDVQLMKQHLPQLQRLQVILFSYPTLTGPSQQAVQSMKLLSAVQVNVCAYAMDSFCLQHLLQQLVEVPLTSLQLAEHGDEFGAAAEALLAELCSCQKLTLRLKNPARRVEVTPSGMTVVYRSF